MTVMTVFLGYPLIRAATVTPIFFYPKRKAQDKQGVSPAIRESRGNVWHTTLQGKV